MSRRAVAAAAALLMLLGIVAGCGDDAGGASGDGAPTVLAAASLTDVLPQIDPAPEYSFAASDTLANQIREGVPADVFAAANTRLPDRLHADGLVERPRIFATNRLVLVVPRDDPAGIRRVSDLRREGVTYVMAAEGVPVGDYTREVLARLGRSDLVAGAASFEQDVRDVLAKVSLGEADAGFVYATDARVAGADVRALPIPARAQPPVRYGIAVVRDAPHRAAAEAFVRAVLGPEGRTRLRAAGFGLP